MELDHHAHRVTKLRAREPTLQRIRRGVPVDLADAVMLGAKRALEAKLPGKRARTPSS